MTHSCKKVLTTTPLSTIETIIQKDGAVIISRGLDKKDLENLHTEMAVHFEQAHFCEGLFFGHKTKRVHSLIVKSEMCRKMALHPLIFQIMTSILGPSCNRIQLNLTQGIEIWPGEQAQILHRDDEMFPTKIRACELMANAMWACTDFTFENGATTVALGSHKWPQPARVPRQDELIQVEMSAGDVLVYLGSLIHGGGANRSSRPRTGIAFGYCLGWLRQYENQYLAVPPYIAKSFPKNLQDLLGYTVHRPNLGMYEGNEPNILFNAPLQRHYTTKDWLTEQQTQNVRDHYK